MRAAHLGLFLARDTDQLGACPSVSVGLRQESPGNARITAAMSAVALQSRPDQVCAVNDVSCAAGACRRSS